MNKDTINNTKNIFGGASWIWPGLAFHDLHNCFAQFRKTFRVEAVPDSAPCLITADQNYRLCVNGRTVCRGPARGYHVSWPYDEVDLAPFLKIGRNVISIRAYSGGVGTFSYRSEGFAGLLFAAHVGDQRLVSDRSWNCRREPGLVRETVPYSFQLGKFQEHVDLRVSNPDWQTLDFDDSKWGSSEELRPSNALPYFALEPREVPNLQESVIKPVCCGYGEGHSDADWRDTNDAASVIKREALSHQRVEGGTDTVSVPAGREGCYRSYVFDLGRVEVGGVKISLEGCLGGEVVDLVHSEVLDEEDMAPHINLADYCRVRMANRLTCRPGRQSHSFFHILGSRYISVVVRENKEPLSLQLELESARYPVERSGNFESSDPELNRIWAACAHTQEICMLDAYVDTPWREQAQWWGDARIQSWNTFHLSGDVRLLRRGIRIMAGQLTPDGLTYGHAPTIAHNCVLPDFALIWILTLWDDYWQTGETVMFEQHQVTVQGILDYFRRWTDDRTGLIQYDPRYWLFLDWNDLQKEGQPALLSLWLLYTLQKLQALFEVTSSVDPFDGLEEWIESLAGSIVQHLLNEEGLVVDGLDDDLKPSGKTSIHCQTLAWLCDLQGFQRERALEHVFLPWLRTDVVTHARPSAYWAAYPLDLLAAEGYGSDVVEFIRRHWKQMAEFGSCFENFDSRPQDSDILSHSHAWSAHPLYLLMRTLGGIRQTAPGWSGIELNPCLVGDSASIRIPSPQGLIEVEWRRAEADPLAVELRIPTCVHLDQQALDGVVFSLTRVP